MSRQEVSDEFRAFFEALLPEHENPDRFGGGRPRRSDRDALNAILFVLRTVCQWNALNATGVCSSSTAYWRSREWTEAGVFEKLWRSNLDVDDELRGLNWSWLNLDGALTKAPLGGGIISPNPTDRAKSATQRSVLVDTDGVPIWLAVAGANVNDFKLMRDTIEGIATKRPRATRGRRQNLCLDTGDDYNEVQVLAATFRFTARIRSRGEEMKRKRRGFEARRWVSERTHRWMNRFRQVVIRWEKKVQNDVVILHLAMAGIAIQ